METIYRSCAGLDVHKKTVEVTVRMQRENGPEAETRRFGTMTRDLLALSDWLAERDVRQVAMESTGVYWQPVYNILDGRFELLLVNAQHVKQVPGRKTDVTDSQWLAQLLQHGLLRSSFVPSRELRELRDLTRQRSQLVAEHSRVANRLHKTLEDANIKLASVASDILGVSGRQMIEALISGEADPQALAELARRRLRGKIPDLQEALLGRVTEHHRFMLRLHYEHLKELERHIETLSERIEVVMRPFQEQIDRLDEIPGINRCLAEVILAEIGPDMSRFPSARHLASWAGLCPGNHESAGKRKKGTTTKGSRWLRQALSQAGWAASRSKNTYLGAQFKRVARTRGQKRAVIAVAHSILGIVYYMLLRGIPYRDLGYDYFLRPDAQRLTRYHVRSLQKLGYQVTLDTAA